MNNLQQHIERKELLRLDPNLTPSQRQAIWGEIVDLRQRYSAEKTIREILLGHYGNIVAAGRAFLSWSKAKGVTRPFSQAICRFAFELENGLIPTIK